MVGKAKRCDTAIFQGGVTRLGVLFCRSATFVSYPSLSRLGMRVTYPSITVRIFGKTVRLGRTFGLLQFLADGAQSVDSVVKRVKRVSPII